MKHGILGAFLSLIFIAPSVWALDPTEPGATEPPSAATMEAALRVTEDDIVLGEPDAPLTIVEYMSLSCNHCASFHTDILPTLKEEFIASGKLRFVVRDFVMNAPGLKAAMTVQCAPAERRAKFQEVLLKLQDRWAFQPNFQSALRKIASVGGLAPDEFDACMDNKTLEEALITQRQNATQSLPISGTPAFFLNGKPLRIKPTVENFREVLKAELALQDEAKGAPEATSASDD